MHNRLTPQRYRVQFTANEEYVKLVDGARALTPRPALDELRLHALRAIVAELWPEVHGRGASP